MTLLTIGFAISAAFHFALASTLFYFVASDIESIEELVPGLIKVEFVSTNPLLSQTEEIISETPSESADPIEPSSALPVAESQPERNQKEAPDIRESEIAEASPVENPDTNSLPSRESVQRVLNNLQRSDASRFYPNDCNKLEEENKFSDCVPNDARDYSALTRNPVYDFHNPGIEISRSRETVTTLARQSARVSEGLALSDLPPGFSDYVLEELEQNIETYSNNSNRALSHMNTMVDKSAAGVMARRLLNPWVQQQSALLKSRRVENRSDR